MVQMQQAFAIVLFVVVGLAVIGAVVALVLSGDAYNHIGRGGLSIGDDRPLRPPSPGSSMAAAGILTPAGAAEREADIRSMLEARAARRAARGEPVGDVDVELEALLRPPAPEAPGSDDPALEAEVRELVESRNARRVARGEEPLDVDAEVARRLRDYGA
jgi:hypothetical protein